MHILNLSILVLFLTISSCAYIFSGTQDTVTVSVPSNTQAQIFYGNNFVGTGAATIIVNRGFFNDRKITVNGLNNCIYPAVNVEKTFNPVSLLNLLWGFGFFIGFGIDAISGAIAKVDTNYYTISPASCKS